MKTIDCEQGSLRWAVERAGRVTASEAHNLISPAWKIRTGEMPRTYLHKKIAEWWTGGPLAQFNTVDMDIGRLLETRARPWYELETGRAVRTVGLVVADDDLCACSPDGLVGDDGGIEIKCPQLHTHTGYLLGGALPDDYAVQVHFSMYVTGRQWWDFVSYSTSLPPLLLRVERDENKIAICAAAVGAFAENLLAARARALREWGTRPARQINWTATDNLNRTHEKT